MATKNNPCPERGAAPRSRGSRTRSWAAALFVVAALASPAAAQSADYVQGKAHWQGRRYPPAEASLLKHRKQPYGSTVEVDFMLGTGGCRIKSERVWGGNVLQHALQRYQMTKASRDTITRELTLCRKSDPMPLLAVTSVESAIGGSAGSMARGKMYYVADKEVPVAAYTARPLGPTDRAAMQARLTPLGSADLLTEKLEAPGLDGGRVVVEGRFAFVSSRSAVQLKAIAKQLESYLSFLERTFGLVRPQSYLTIYLTANVNELRAIARSRHNLDVSPATIGYTYQDDLSAVAVTPGAKIGTLKHELFHLLVRSSFGDIPQWLDEGIAALYEVSVTKGDAVTGLDNWRGAVLAKEWSQRPTLAELIGQSWFVSDRPSSSVENSGPGPLEGVMKVQFGVARYFALWLQQRNKLVAVYQAVRAIEPGRAADPVAADRAAVESVIGPLAAAQVEFDAWFRATHRVHGTPPARSTARALDLPQEAPPLPSEAPPPPAK